MLRKLINKMVNIMFVCKTEKSCRVKLAHDERMCSSCEKKMYLWYKGIYKP